MRLLNKLEQDDLFRNLTPKPIIVLNKPIYREARSPI